MANVKISELIQIIQADIDSADIVNLVDVSDDTMAATGTNKRATVEDFAGAVSDRLIGFQDFSDTTTPVTPLQITSPTGGVIQLTNDASGQLTDGNTNVNATTTVKGVNDLYNSSNNFFEFDSTGLEANDIIGMRIHLKVTPNTVPMDLDVNLTFYDDVAGGGSEVFKLKKRLATFSQGAGVEYEIIESVNYFIGASIINGSKKVEVTTNAACDIVNVGYNVTILKNN